MTRQNIDCFQHSFQGKKRKEKTLKDKKERWKLGGKYILSSMGKDSKDENKGQVMKWSIFYRLYGKVRFILNSKEVLSGSDIS